MQEERDLTTEEKEEQVSLIENEPPETAEHPVPGIKHEHEPDAEYYAGGRQTGNFLKNILIVSL